MKKILALLSSALLLCSCSNAPKNTINITIEDTNISIDQGILNNEDVTINLHNQSKKSQTIKIQGLQINYISPLLTAQNTQELHFSLQHQRGNLVVSSTDSDNQVITSTISIQ